MSQLERIINHKEVSEKVLEKYLSHEVKRRGWLSLKYSNPYQVGYPDRLILGPLGRSVWVEVKSRGEKPRKIQALRHDELRALGHDVRVINSRESIKNLITDLQNGAGTL